MRKKIIGYITLIIVSILLTKWSYSNANLLEDNKNNYEDAYIELNEFAGGNESSIFKTPDTNYESSNPIKELATTKSSYPEKFDLRNLIPQNTGRMYQKSTSLCWDFTTMDILETTLALDDYYNKKVEKLYDFSEINGAYSLTTNYFLNNAVNKNGLNRNPNNGGFGSLGIDLITSIGVVNESFMPFNDWYNRLYNNEKIDISYINDKQISAQVLDTIDFPVYNNAAITLSNTEFEKLNNRVKNHLMNYGGIYLSMSYIKDKSINMDTKGIYCPNTSLCATNHSLTIIGWDDNYPKEKLGGNSHPNNNGAWIVNNSMGNDEVVNLDVIREQIRPKLCGIDRYKSLCKDMGWNNNPGAIDVKYIDETIVINKYTIDYENNTAVQYDDGIYYISYEDAWIHSGLKGIIKATTNLTYDNLYQHNIAANWDKEFTTNSNNNMYVKDIFKRNDTNKEEYLSSVAMYAAETNKVKVYVNPNGSSTKKEDLKLIELKDGESETFNAGFHTLEFKDLIKLTGNEFAIVLEITGTRNNKVLLKLEGSSSNGNYSKLHTNGVNGQGSYSLDLVNWTSYENYALDGTHKGADTTIKAYTVTDIEKLEITTKPTKTKYIEGENFDPTGMVIKAVYKDGNKISINNYTLENNNNLSPTTKKVTIKYLNKIITQKVEVEKNTVVKLEIEGKIKTEYIEGENFDRSNLKVFATYKNGDRKEITNYEIINGSNLKIDQDNLIVKYEDVEYKITIKVNPKKIIDDTKPDNNKPNEENNKDDNKEEVKVIIKKIEIKNLPNKTLYYLNEDINLTGGVIKVVYSNKTEENIKMTDKLVTIKGYDKIKIGKQVITVTYKENKTTFEISVIEKEEVKLTIFDNAIGNVKSLDYYYYTEGNKEDYMLLDISVEEIIKGDENCTYEYYYYLSSYQDENSETIKNWIKIEESQIDNTKLEFKVNTLNVNNKELIKNDNLYVYIKEETKNDKEFKEIISKPIKIEKTNNIKEYINDVLKENVIEFEDKEENKNTVEQKDFSIVYTMMIIIILLLIIALGILIYKRFFKQSS